MTVIFFSAIGKKDFKIRYINLYTSIFVNKEIGHNIHHQHFKTSYKMFKEKKFLDMELNLLEISVVRKV